MVEFTPEEIEAIKKADRENVLPEWPLFEKLVAYFMVDVDRHLAVILENNKPKHIE